MNQPAIVVNEIDLDFTLHDSGIRQIARALLGPLGKTIFGGYRTFKALNSINFTLNKGEVLRLIGNNGSGKSNL